jgi:maltooligosyltrehalose synthase
MTQATGTFQVKLDPQAVTFEASGLGRLSIDKQFQGDLQAASKGEMLAHRTAVQGSAGYVAMERVEGTLHGRAGTFVLQHSGTMNRGVQQLALTVVPDSATGELEGLSGSMKIIIDDGRHSYEFEYELRAEP